MLSVSRRYSATPLIRVAVPSRRPFSSRASSGAARTAAKPWGALALTAVGAGSIGARLLSTGKGAVKCESQAKEPKEVKKEDDDSILPSFEEIKKTLKVDVISESIESWGKSFTEYRDLFNLIQREINGKPGSLYDKVVSSTSDERLNPEMQWDAHVRLGNDLAHAEKAFLRNRRRVIRDKFAKLVGVDPEEVDMRDLPVVGLAGSGGGYRAMVSTLGNLKGAKDSGILDVVTYVSAVSGSCWAMNLLYSLGENNLEKTMEHVKDRITVPFLHPSTMDLLTKSPTNRYLLSGAMIKDASKGGTTSLVDIYGTLVSARLLVPNDPNKVDFQHLKISNQRVHTDSGAAPLPLYCMVRHEVPDPDSVTNATEKEQKAMTPAKKAEFVSEREKALANASWLWFETSPYETGCAEIAAWIPTYAVGRLFDKGKSVERQPELSLTIFNGVFASAFCATLFNYYTEVKPLLSTLPFFAPIDKWISTDYARAIDAIHPVPPAEIPNFLKGLQGQLQGKTSEQLTSVETFNLLDAGAHLNIPYVPLFRRDCDVIIALDASADQRDVWFNRAKEYASQMKLDSWPDIHVSDLFKSPDPLPPPSSADEKAKSPAKGDGKRSTHSSRKEERASDRAAETVEEAHLQEKLTSSSAPGSRRSKPDNPEPPPVGSAPRSDQQRGEDGELVKASKLSREEREPPLGKCNIWLGASKREGDGEGKAIKIKYRNDHPTVDQVRERDGIVLAYFPLLGGEGLEDPMEVWSTWKFDYEKEQTEALFNLSSSAFKGAEGELRNVLKGVWLRKRDLRIADEKKARRPEKKDRKVRLR